MKSSKYFLNLEKRNKSKSQIRKILSSDNDREYTDPEEIMNELKAFYSSPYTRRSMKSKSECLSYLHTVNIPKLTESEKDSCEGRLTKKEIWEALNSMANNKSPGNDGLSKEFYVCFFNEIHTCLLNTLNCSFSCGHMTSSQRQAMITLIEKKGRDKRLLKNWRPISLINVDAKMASKALALRIRKILSSLTSSDQTAYVKGRYIGESVRLLNDILEYTDNNNIEAILFSADFEKAFDSVDHTFLFATLTESGFGRDLIQWVKTFLKDSESFVMNNGDSSGYFPLNRGTRQGDPLSAYLFILVLEVMLIQIRENDNIKGINVGNFDIKLSAFADDTYFFTLDTQSLRYILETCSVFEDYSSLKLNLDKSQGCWIGAAKGKLDKPLECGWINIERKKISVLGIYLSYNRSLVENCNFLNMLSCIKESLNLLECRGLTLGGRIQIFKSLALSKTIYASTMIHPSKKFMDQLYSLQKNFIWRGRPSEIKHTSLIADYVDGGYKDVHIATKLESLKIMWIRCMLENNFHVWKAISHTFDIPKLFHNNFQPSQTCKNKINLYPKFYQELISLWEKVCIKEPVDPAEIFSQSIWNNHFLQKQDSTLFYPELYRRGVSSIRDMVDEHGKLLTWCFFLLAMESGRKNL